ncbi:MAG: radical SAM protein [bacterium]
MCKSKIASSGEYKFEAGKPACPVACKYCFVTEHDTRREVWNKQPLAGLNKACTFVNVSPWIGENPEEQVRFLGFPWEILKGDMVGFTAVSDPLWPALDQYLWHFLERVSPLAKVATCVSKWPVSRETMKRLAQVPNFMLVVTITGNHQPIERVTVRQHLKTLELAKEMGVKALPISHPYIAGVSDLSFLSELKKLGYDEFDVKGFRYCDARMRSWMPERSRQLYLGREDEEVLPEDGWRDLVAEAGLKLVSPREWYLREGMKNNPHLSHPEAKTLVREVMKLANVVSSSSTSEVFEAAVRRRM